MKTPNVKWSVSLSDGQTIFEEKGEYKSIEGEPSPWQKLQKLIQESGLTITSFCLYTDDGKRWNLPSAGRNPKFRVFDVAEKPKSYRAMRIMGADILGGQYENEDHYAIAEALYEGGKKLQIWVSEANPENSWSVIV